MHGLEMSRGTVDATEGRETVSATEGRGTEAIKVIAAGLQSGLERGIVNPSAETSIIEMEGVRVVPTARVVVTTMAGMITVVRVPVTGVQALTDHNMADEMRSRRGESVSRTTTVGQLLEVDP